jgi:hypothetical protein
MFEIYKYYCQCNRISEPVRGCVLLDHRTILRLSSRSPAGRPIAKDDSRITRFKEEQTVNPADNSLSVELIRWTFSVTPEHRVEIETHLLDLGLEVQARGEDTLTVTWDEPEGGVDELIEELWAINGEPFEVTHEEFHRVNMLVYQPEEVGGDAEKAVA